MIVVINGVGAFFLFVSLLFLSGVWIGRCYERSGGGASRSVRTPSGSVPPLLEPPLLNP